MSEVNSNPSFFVEITCLTSPHPCKKLLVEVPRVTLAHAPFPLYGAFENQEIDVDRSFPRVRELELLDGYRRYDIRKSSDKRWFISFKDVSFKDEPDFFQYARGEIARVNRVIGTTLPRAATIIVEDRVYVAVSDTQLTSNWQNAKQLAQAVQIEVVDEFKIVEEWNKFIGDIVNNPSKYLFGLLDREGIDPILTTCIQLISENSFQSFYKAFEVLAKHYGGHHKFVKLGLFTRGEISRFTDNAQASRHAHHRLSTKAMPFAEAKLFILHALRFYMNKRR